MTTSSCLGTFLALHDQDRRDIQIARLLALRTGPALREQEVIGSNLFGRELGDHIVIFLFQRLGQRTDFGRRQEIAPFFSVQQLQNSQNGVSIDEPSE